MPNKFQKMMEDEVRRWMSVDEPRPVRLKPIALRKGERLLSTYEEMVGFLDSAWCVRDEIVPCLVGPVGIGKTAAVEEHCRNMGAKRVVKIVASQILPNEVSGITMPDSKTKAMEIYDHYRLSSLEDGDILFFDELLEADQLVLSACLTLIESRELMSGKKLPDIQIVAATNPTVKPASLKANIRQRFVFRKFGIDYQGCRLYIKEKYGIDVDDLVNSIREDEVDSYNILSQRSLTKMARWITSVPMDEAPEVASQIDKIWECRLGTKMLRILQKNEPEVELRRAIKTICADLADERGVSIDKFMRSGTTGIPSSDIGLLKTAHDIFQETSIAELYDILTGLPEWEEISGKLEKISCPE